MPEGVHSADQRETDQLATHQAEISWKHVSRYPKKKFPIILFTTGYFK
jgi:hypothetical protein